MSRLFQSARVAAVAGLGLALFGANLVLAAPGSPLIIGVINDAAASQTSLEADSAVNGLRVVNDGAGNAGYFVSDDGSGIAGITTNATRFALVGTNDGASFGGGGALNAAGKQNHGVFATTANPRGHAIHAVNTSSAIPPDLLAPGRASGVYGETRNDYGFGVYGRAASPDGGGIGIGVAGVTQALDGYGVYGGMPDGGLGYAGYFDGPIFVSGTIEAEDCICPLAVTIARNAGGTVLAAGQAVELQGVEYGPDGRIVVLVGPATGAGQVVGLAGNPVTARQTNGRTTLRVVTGAIGAGAHLTVVTAGVTSVRAPAGWSASTLPGTQLRVDSAGRLAVATDVSSAVGIGRYLGLLPDGRLAVEVRR